MQVESFSFLRFVAVYAEMGEVSVGSNGSSSQEFVPSFQLTTDKEIYRPGDFINTTIDINVEDRISHEVGTCPFLIESLSVEIKGIEKLDTQWYATKKPAQGSKQKRGEVAFLDSSSASIVSKVIIPSGGTRTYLVRAELPKYLPPSYRGTTIHYFYYIRSSLSGRWLYLDNAPSNSGTQRDLIHLESRCSLNIWANTRSTSLTNYEDAWPTSVLQIEVLWKEQDMDSDWARANEASGATEDDCDSARDDASSVASFSISRGNLDSAFGSSLSLQSQGPPGSFPAKGYLQVETSPLNVLPPVSTTEITVDTSGRIPSPVGANSSGKSALQRRLSSQSSNIPSPNQLKRSLIDELSERHSPRESVQSEGFVRGRSYNIRLDDQTLLRFSPKNSDSTYCFSDMIGGGITLFHEEGLRRCLEVSITLETSETINQSFVHPSRRNSPTITKVHSEYHEVVADLVQTCFLFSIPTDGPMSFSTPRVSVQWHLRFEFFTTPLNVDWKRYSHPLLIEGREKGEWVLPITVLPPPPRSQSSQSRAERTLSSDTLWVRT